MAFFDEHIETSNGTKKRVFVRSSMGGTDRRIYVNNRESGYKLGSGNNKIYTSSGREVSSASLKEFAKMNLWWW